MRPIAIRYVRDVDAVREFYAVLGLKPGFSTRPSRQGIVAWTELCGPDSGVALHHVPDGCEPPPLELCFESDEPLELVAGRLRGAGYELATEIVDESFGRSFTVRDPEGLLIQVNELDQVS